MRFLRDIVRGFQNLWWYFPVVWRDRNWDGYYIFFILKKKLERHHHYLLHSKYCMHYVGRLKDAKRIRMCVLLLDRLIKGDYYNMLDIKWEDPSDFILPICYGCKTIGRFHGKGFTEYESYMMNQDLDLLCKIINKHIFGWWD